MSDRMPHDEELRVLYRKLPADEPRAQLDDAILSAARRRSDVEQRRTFLARLRWTVPLAAAAGVVLTMTLTRLTPEQSATSPVADARNRTPARQDAAPAAKRPEAAKLEAPPVAAPPAGEAHAKARSFGEMAGAAPQAKEFDAGDGAASDAPGAEIAGGEASGATTTDALAKEDAWPFGLEAGLAPEEACRRVAAALHRECAFRGDIAVVITPAVPVPIDRGRFSGRSTSRLTLALRDGRLHSVALRFPGATGDELLIAPEPAR